MDFSWLDSFCWWFALELRAWIRELFSLQVQYVCAFYNKNERGDNRDPIEIVWKLFRAFRSNRERD